MEEVEFEFRVKPSIDPELSQYVLDFFGIATMWDDESGEDKVVGEISGNRIDIAQAKSDALDLDATIESISPDLSDFWHIIARHGACFLDGEESRKEGKERECAGLVFISRVKVEPDCRSCGIGTRLIQQMSQVIDLGDCLIALKAFPLAEEQYGESRSSEAIGKVRHFYEKLGFKPQQSDFMTKDARDCLIMRKRRERREALESQSV